MTTPDREGDGDAMTAETTPDLHVRCVAEVTRLRTIAEAAANTRERMSLDWPRTAGKDALINFWRDWSPSTALRVCDWADGVLGRHARMAVSPDYPDEICSGCGQGWPCDELFAAARALGIPDE